MREFKLGDYSFALVRKPSNVFRGSEREKLVDELTDVARSAFGPHMTREDVAAHVLPVSSLLLIKKGGSVVGFSGTEVLTLNRKKFVYLTGSAIKREEQGQGLYSLERALSLLAAGTQAKPHFVGARTQNPLVYAFLAKIGVWPRHTAENPPSHVV
ncbi:MAG: hypothetical protein AB1626_05340, partial [Candidatus Micrarchaeota archaeon]